MWSKVGMGGEHHRYYKHNKFHQNPRGDPKFLDDLTRNDPFVKPYLVPPFGKAKPVASYLCKHNTNHRKREVTQGLVISIVYCGDQKVDLQN